MKLVKSILILIICVSASIGCGTCGVSNTSNNEAELRDTNDSMSHIKRNVREIYYRYADTTGTVTFRHGRLFDMLKRAFAKTNIPVAQSCGHPDFFPEIFRSIYQKKKFINQEDTLEYDYFNDTIFAYNTNTLGRLGRVSYLWSKKDFKGYLMEDEQHIVLIKRGFNFLDSLYEISSPLVKWDLDSIRRIIGPKNPNNHHAIYCDYSPLLKSCMRFIIKNGEIVKIDTISNIFNSSKRYPKEENEFFNGEWEIQESRPFRFNDGFIFEEEIEPNGNYDNSYYIDCETIMGNSIPDSKNSEEDSTWFTPQQTMESLFQLLFTPK